MPQMKRDCPHCHTKNAAFVPFGDIKQAENDRTFTTAFHCTGCYGGLIAEIWVRGGQAPTQFTGDVDRIGEFTVQYVYPKPEETRAPEYLPENIRSFYLQAAGSLQAKNYDASAMMSRKALEAAVKRALADGKGSLYNRIEQLATMHKVTPELKDWAHAIRIDGNTATHEDTPVEEEFAKELLSYVEMFLLYSVTMPAMIANRRSDKDGEEPAAVSA